MDRLFAYPSQQPTDTQWLNAELKKMVALGYLAQGVLGTNAVVDGLACYPSTPASLAVLIGPGAIYQQEPIDAIAFGSIGVDVVDQIIKQGIIMPVSSLTLTPPNTSGQAINYLIQAELSEIDTGATQLSYFNAAQPSQPFSGPGGSGATQPTIRQCTVSLVAKAGAAATAGSQATPAPDAGYVGLWVVTVANGVTQLTSAQISQYPGAPFISVKLPQVPNWVQGQSWAYADDTGTANQINVTLNPTPTVIGKGFTIRTRKINTASTGAMTIVVNNAAAQVVVAADGSAMSSTQVMPANYLADLTFDGTSWRFTNDLQTSAVGSLSASSGEGINVNGSGVVALSYPSLSSETNLAGGDLWSFYSQADTHHRVVTWAQLVSSMQLSFAAPQVTVLQANQAGTYATPTGAKYLVVEGVGGGGSGSAQGTAGNPGGNTTFGTLVANGGVAAPVSTTGAFAAGSTATGGDINWTGGQGGWWGLTGGNDGWTMGLPGGQAAGPLAGPAGAATAGSSPGGQGSNAGYGSGGGGAPSLTTVCPGGGAAGAFSKVITNPAASYAYSVGAGGAPVTAPGYTSGKGGDGLIRIIAHFA